MFSLRLTFYEISFLIKDVSYKECFVSTKFPKSPLTKKNYEKIILKKFHDYTPKILHT